MKLKELQDLPYDILLPLLHECGVKTISFGDTSITLQDNYKPNRPTEPSRFEDESKDDKQPCGHSIWEANEVGECLHGCLPQKEE